MPKKELLVPVGNQDALLQAVHNGADAVYLAGKEFGARKFADNFTNEEMIEAIHLCHLYGVKIYVTVNTLVYENEVEHFIDYIKFLYLNHVDAVIMQDIGMICLVRECFPNLEIHASTQVNNQSRQDLDVLEKLGVTRVVLARELSLDEINLLKTKMELEVFIHGALCICYSGCCLFSSMVGGRSGNRGECAGSCRLPYQLLESGKVVETEGDYLLSTKELNTSSYLEELMKSNITSFKIEGRMKSPEYVGFITRFYRTLMDQYELNGTVEIDESLQQELKTLFHREFTKGHLFHETNEGLMNIKSPNHIGISIGKVLEVTTKQIKIKLSDKLVQGDGIRFLESGKGMMVNFLYDEKGKLIHEANAGNTIYVDNKIGLMSLDEVRKTQDVRLLKRLQTYSKRKLFVQGKVIAKINEPICFIVTDQEQRKVEVFGEVVQEASKMPITKERITEQLKKTGNTPFTIEAIDFDIDENIFLSIKGLNDIRRKALELLEEKRIERNQECPILPLPKLDHLDSSNTKLSLTVFVRTEEQLRTCLSLSFDRIYVGDKLLYQKYCHYDTVYYELPRYHLKGMRKTLASHTLVTSLGGLEKKNENAVSDYTMNVVNRYSIYYLQKYGVSTVTLSCELEKEQIGNLLQSCRKHMKKTPSVEKIIYGRIDLMIMKHCLLNHLIQNGKKPCKLCRNGKIYQLRDRKGVLYPIVTKREITRILSSVIDETDFIKDDIEMGVSSFRLQLFDETKSDIQHLYKKVKAQLEKTK